MKKLALILALALALCLTTSALAETVFQLGTTVNEQDSFQVAAVKFAELVAEQEASQIEALKANGMEIVENPDVESFRAAVTPVYEAYPQYADYIARIQAALAE